MGGDDLSHYGSAVDMFEMEQQEEDAAGAVGAAGKAVRQLNDQLDTAILNRQTRSTQLVGLVDLHFTVGKAELDAFGTANEFLLQTKQPSWVKLEKNWALPKQKKKQMIHLWYMRGTGKEVMTDVSLHVPPKNHKNSSANKSRVHAMKFVGLLVAGHAELEVELHGYCALKMGESAPAVDGIEVVEDEDEEEELMRRGYEMVEPGLKAFAEVDPELTLWVHSKRMVQKARLNMLSHNTLKDCPWYDTKLKLAMESYAIPPQAVLEMHHNFEEMDYASEGAVDVLELWNWLGEPRAKRGLWLLKCVEAESSSHVTFGEYVSMIAMYCMFGRQDVMRFIFGNMDEDNRSYLDEQQYVHLIELLAENEPIPIHPKKLQGVYRRVAPRGELFFEQFVLLMEHYTLLCYPMFRLQNKLQEKNMGLLWWKQQQLKFEGARNRLSITKTKS